MQAGVQGRLCLKASSAPGGPGPPPRGNKSPSPSLPPLLHLAEQQEQQVPSGQVVTLCPKLSAAINNRLQAQ